MVSILEKEDDWFHRHANLAAAFIALAGLLARLWASSGTFLNPDEALHFRLANQSSLALVYKESLTSLHPPLFVLLLHLWRGPGTSDLWMRLPSIIAGTIFCWVFFKWLTLVAGRLAGLIGVMFAALLPPQIMLSAEVRQYALLLAFLSAALYFLERAFAEGSAALMLASTPCLYCAMMTHYSAFLFAGALGAYALSKIFVPRAQRPRGGVVRAWVVGQLGALALCLLLYKTHLSRRDFGDSQILRGGMSYIGQSSYFQSGRDNPLLFVAGHSFGVFQFLFGQPAVGIAMGLAFLVGLWLILRGRALAENVLVSRRLTLLLILPFMLACGASYMHVYPYGGTRHAAFLTIPAVAGVSVALACLAAAGSTKAGSTGRRWARGIAITALVLAACIAFGKPRRPTMKRADQSLAHMAAAIEFIQTKIGSSEPIFTDYQTELMLGRYLCPQPPVSFEAAPATFEQFSCAGHRIVSNDFRGWMFEADTFLQQWQRLVQAYRLQPGDTVWIVQAGWDADLAENLRHQFPEFHDLGFESFGDNIKIFNITVGRPMPAAAPLPNSK
jgi:hypothetical protein